MLMPPTILPNRQDYEDIAPSDKATYCQLAIESIPVAIVLTDVNGTILYVNPATEIITGFNRHELLGRTPRLWGAQMKKEFYDELWFTIKTKKQTFSKEIINKRKDGTKYLSSLIIKPLFKHDNLSGFLGIEQDITIMRRIQDKAAYLEKELKDIYRLENA
ncbi:MAG: PAS domain S-box protein [Nanoarchaeota archaeon]